MNNAIESTSVPDLAGMHPDERLARVQLAACYRIFERLGWTEMIYNHITLRLPASVTGGKRHFQVATYSMGLALPIPEDIAQRCARDALQFDVRNGAGQDVFDSLVRQLDRVDTSYKD